MKFWSGPILVLALVAASACGGPAAAPAQPGEQRQGQQTAPPGVAIASAHSLATDAGLEIISQGGNAFDAAIAVSAALSVVEPISSGIGGGGFFLLHQADSGRDVFVDARETSPAAVTQEHYLTEDGEFDRDRRSEEHTSELQSRPHLVCRLLLEKKKRSDKIISIYKRSPFYCTSHHMHYSHIYCPLSTHLVYNLQLACHVMRCLYFLYHSVFITC